MRNDWVVMMRIIALSLWASLLVSCSTAPQSPLKRVGEDPLRAIVSEKMSAYGVPGVQVCIKNRDTGKSINLALGYADLKAGTPLLSTTQMKIGSITKSFTALGILLLAERRELSLDDEIGKYLQIGNEAYHRIKVRQLMNMYSGLRGYINDDDSSYIIDTVMADPARQFSPEELSAYGFRLTDTQGVTGPRTFHYTNTNYILLGMIIERVSRTGYADFIRREFVEPLRLHSTFVPNGNRYGRNVSSGYHMDQEEHTTVDVSAIDPSYVWSAGAIISTANNLCDWIISVDAGRIVSGGMQDYLYTGLKTPEGEYTAGLIAEQDRLWHNGTLIGYHGELCYLKKSHIAIAVLSNCSLAGSDGDPVKEIMNGIIALVSGGRLPI